MQKIMFNENYGLESAVLELLKDMTRRIIGQCDEIESHIDNGGHCLCEIYTQGIYAGTTKSGYKIGEVVAIAQRYSVLNEKCLLMDDSSFSLSRSKGWNNKMFVKPDLMPHRIRITDIKVERLQDISEEDCLREGIRFYNCGIDCGFTTKGLRERYGNAKEAFAVLIDRVSGIGTWERNPYVYAYTFKLLETDEQ